MAGHRPQGFDRETEYEVGAFLRNNLLSQPQPDGLLARRIDQFPDELECQRDMIAGWGLAYAILADLWNLEDTGQIWGEPTVCARLISEL